MDTSNLTENEYERALAKVNLKTAIVIAIYNGFSPHDITQCVDSTLAKIYDES